jgi:hypothetical protein
VLHGRDYAQLRKTMMPTKAMKYPPQAIAFSSLVLFSSFMGHGAIRDGTFSIQARSSARA